MADRSDIANWISQMAAVRRSAAEEMSAEFFANPANEIPLLVFDSPICPICLEHTEFDGDRFVCLVCEVAWNPQGYYPARIREEFR